MTPEITPEIISIWFLYFIIYSILGWGAETVYCSVLQRKFAERGFLTGPYCPIYGFGAMIVLAVLAPFTSHPLAIFLLGMVLTSALEYFSSFLMEKFFHMRWWDYSAHRFNIKGRVCLLNSTMFGVLCLVISLMIHPFVVTVIGKIPTHWLYIVAVVVFVGFTADCIYSTRATLKLSKHLAKIEELQQKVKDELEDLKDNIDDFREEREEKFREWLDDLSEDIEDRKEARDRWQQEMKAKREDYRNRLAALKKPKNYQERRILRSFPTLSHNDVKLNSSLDEIKEVLKRKRH